MNSKRKLQNQVADVELLIANTQKIILKLNTTLLKAPAGPVHDMLTSTKTRSETSLAEMEAMKQKLLQEISELK